MKLLDVVNSVWAIEPARLDEIVEIYATHLRGEKIDLSAIEAQLGRPLGPKEQGYEVRDGVAVIPIDGVMSKRMNMFSKISGGASTELVARDVRAALDDPRVQAIVLQIDSPGGNVEGVQELATLIYDARERKRIVALADSKMSSAAYWVGAAAAEVYMTGGTTVMGSIGTVMKHVNVKRSEERAGIETTEIYSGKYKRIASDQGPLSEEGRAYLQAQTDYMYSVFVDDVARFRGVSAEVALERMADGRVFIGQQAIDAGLADGVSSLDALVAHLVAGTPPAGIRSERPRPAGAAAGASESEVQTSATQNGGNDMNEITAALIAANHADIAEHFRAEGRTQGLEQGRVAGVTAERERIQAIEAQALPGHEALIATLKFDGKTTGEQAAVQVLAAERQKTAGRSRDLQADARDLTRIEARPSAHGVEPPAADPQKDKSKPVEERCKAAWEASAEIRAEFATLDDYTAATRALESGKVRVLGARSA